jgi:MFS family permease
VQGPANYKFTSEPAFVETIEMNPSAARLAAFATFLLHGTLLGSWAPHIAFAKERLEAGPGLFGLALLSLPFGAVIAMPIAGALINLFGSAAVTLTAGILFCILVLGPPHAADLWQFIGAGILLGAAIGSMDVAMNAHGLAVEKAIRKPIMSVLHGGFSLGAIIGAFASAPLISVLGPTQQILLVSAVCLITQLVASRYYLPADTDRGLSGSHFAWPTSATIGLGMLCFLALMIEGSILDWGAIYMRERFAIDAAFAAIAFGSYQGGMAIARFTGDVLRVKIGAVKLVFASALLAAIGTALAILAPGPVLAIIAFAFAGLGIGNVAPVLFAGGGRLEPDAPGRGIAAVTTLGYSGFLAGPPLIGFAAELTNLQIGLGLTVIAAAVIAFFARYVSSADTY